MVESLGFVHPTSFSGKPSKVLKQESNSIPVTISKSFPSLHAVWKIAGRKAQAEEGRPEGGCYSVPGSRRW